MDHSKNQSFIKRLSFASRGFSAALRSEHSLRFQLLALVGIIAVLVYFRPEPLWWALSALTAAGVIAAELINTAIEALADHLHPLHHPQIGFIKDCSAAAVLVCACGALVVGGALALHLYQRGLVP